MNEPRISTPASTGGAGHTFEQHVAAYWLAQLLVRGTPPILIDCSVIEVRLQTEYLGWRTDDFLIIGQDSAGKCRQLIGQVKRKFTVSAANDGFRKAIGDFWSDFTNDELFSANTSRFVLVTQRGTDSLLEHFVGLLDCARAASDGADFGQRLAKPGFISNRAAGYCAQVREVVGAIEGRPFTDAEIWPLLRCLHVLNLDLQTSTRQIEALIKSLLAHTVEHLDGTGAAEKAWDTLLAIASDGMATARSFRRSDLPDALTQCHRAIDGREHEALRALKEHTETVLNGIRSTIGNEFHLPRAGLVQNVLQPLESTQIVLVSGPAGSGKSVVARGAVDVLAADHFVFGFRAEEFAQPHLDATLQNGQIPVNSAVLSAILASQDRKVLLIESVERLLETTTRDAFSDLLRLASADTTLRIVLTCRDYSTGLVHTSLLASMPREHAVIEVPPLSDIELVAVERSLPALARPLANPSLRLLLSNPYFLDKALQISWTSDRPLPESQRELRAQFWCQVVRAEDRSVAGMPQRRNDSFQQIALRRARALTAYVSCEGLDPGVVDSLRHDSLIVSSDQDPVLVAPAHDVLEDWALLEWIDHQSTKSDSSFRTLAEAIGTHPAVRRAYRIWVAELIDRDAEAADRLFKSSATEQDISAQFRDDILVSLLRASSSPSFLERHVTELLANDKDLLKRVIHLLRVACVTTPSWLPDDVAPASVFNVPEGAAWAAVLRIVQIHIPMFTAPERPLMLALINDWANGVAVWSPYPAGAESAAAIAHRLLPDLEMHSHAEAGHQALTVIAKIPLADATRFESLLRGANDDELDSMADEFRDIVFAGLDGNPAARDLPDLLVAVASDYLLCSEADLQHRECYGTSMELESSFGMKNQLYHKYYPPSAYRGPWLRLLRDHPGKGLGFLIEVINHSADWYAHPRVSERVESPFEIELAFADGTSQKQWCSSRLWQWYRGLSVGPDALQSLLMTLERWIFESAKAEPSELDKTLLNLLQKSDSAAVTAVVASIATAFPHSSSETLLVLLSSRPCIQLDSERAVTESVSPPGWSTSLAWHGASDMVYQAERKEANALPHRNYDLERAILNLQSGPHAARVQAVLDQYRDALPPSLEQNDDDRLWRLALHRMDVRKYSATEVDAAKFEEGSETSSVERPRALRLDWDELESDVKAMVERRFTESESPNARIELLTWASNVFEKRESGLYDPRHWKQQLDRARSPDVTGADELDVARGGPGFIAAVCVRDHWLEMSPDERDWCVDMVWSEVVRPTYSWDWGNRIQLNMTSADRPCASILPLLIEKQQLTALQEGRAREAFATALMHPVDEVDLFASVLRRHGLVAGFARCLVDRREPGKIRHTLAELLGQRIFGIACGHPDGNDANHLADDPIHKLLLGRDPVAGEALASQPTISRFENGVGRSALYELGRELAMRVIERHQRRLDGRARRITIDLDPTDDATHGAQQLTFFNGHYDSWCYLPLLAFLTFDKEREQ